MTRLSAKGGLFHSLAHAILWLNGRPKENYYTINMTVSVLTAGAAISMGVTCVICDR